MAKLPLIVIGASAGGLDALASVLDRVSPDLEAAIIGVIHIGAFDAKLPSFFKNRGPLPVRYGQDGEQIQRGVVYLAPPDRHLLIGDERIVLTRGPRENHTRPAIDPLFRSAAEHYGPLAIGVVLTGYLSDGTAGLWEVKRRGGQAIVQAPDEAQAQSMPQSAAAHVDVDYCLPVKEIGPLLNRLAAETAKRAPPAAVHSGGPEMTYTSDHPIAFTCPDCGGAMRKISIGSYAQFKCHIGHTFGMPEMAEAQFEVLETALETALRILNERKDFCREGATDAQLRKDVKAVKAWEEAAAQTETRFDELANLIEAEWKPPEGVMEVGAAGVAAKR